MIAKEHKGKLIPLTFYFCEKTFPPLGQREHIHSLSLSLFPQESSLPSLNDEPGERGTPLQNVRDGTEPLRAAKGTMGLFLCEKQTKQGLPLSGSIRSLLIFVPAFLPVFEGLVCIMRSQILV